jgi:hypothetical protein
MHSQFIRRHHRSIIFFGWLYIPGNFTLSNLFGFFAKENMCPILLCLTPIPSSSRHLTVYSLTLHREEWPARRADRLTN